MLNFDFITEDLHARIMEGGEGGGGRGGVTPVGTTQTRLQLHILTVEEVESLRIIGSKCACSQQSTADIQCSLLCRSSIS